MIFINSPFILPLLIIIWSVDAWLFLASARLILGKIAPANQFSKTIILLTDPLPQLVKRWILHWFKKAMPTKAAWLLTIVAVLILRYVFAWFVISL